MNITTIALAVLASVATGVADPAFVTSDPNGGWSTAGYYVHNNMWNSAKYHPCTSTLYASSHDQWYVVTRMNNQKGDGAVKTYPKVHKDYHGVAISAFDSITSTFAETSPRVGIYNVAYDLWINGIARPGCTEIMIWTENFNQVPGGRFQEEATFHGRAYRVYRTPDQRYLAFVARTNFNSGTVNLLNLMKWALAKGWLPDNSTLDQVCFGVEMVSTDDKNARFQVTAFSIDEKLKPKPNLPVPAGASTNPPSANGTRGASNSVYAVPVRRWRSIGS